MTPPFAGTNKKAPSNFSLVNHLHGSLVVWCMCYINDHNMVNTMESVELDRHVRSPSNQHISNVPLMYNPSTIHDTPPVLSDEGYKSLLPLWATEHNVIMDRLLEKSSWMHPSKSDDDLTFYSFDTFWYDYPPPDYLVQNWKRHRCDSDFSTHLTVSVPERAVLAHTTLLIPLTNVLQLYQHWPLVHPLTHMTLSLMLY